MKELIKRNPKTELIDKPFNTVQHYKSTPLFVKYKKKNQTFNLTKNTYNTYNKTINNNIIQSAEVIKEKGWVVGLLIMCYKFILIIINLVFLGVKLLYHIIFFGKYDKHKSLLYNKKHLEREYRKKRYRKNGGEY